MAGTLYLVPTPIGNLGDISQRMAQTLAEADLSRRRTPGCPSSCSNHLGLKKPMLILSPPQHGDGGPGGSGPAAGGGGLRPGHRRGDARHL